MATLVLTSAASAFASSYGFSAFATAALGVGAGLVGNAIDQRVFGKDTNTKTEGPRLDEVRFQGSDEGSPIHRSAGRNRVAGNVIWTTKYREEITTSTTSSGGGKGGKPKNNVTTTEYNYYVSFAVAVCEGTVQQFGRIWVDGAVLDQTTVTIRRYYGTETQSKDPKIVATEGDDVTSAYRGTAYIVFEEMELSVYGNRIPQINIEVYRSPQAGLDEYENEIEGFCVIPASGEFAYGTTAVTVFDEDNDTSLLENKHGYASDSDWTESIDQLEALAPNAKRISLVVAWHGTDLRVGSCEIQPRVESLEKGFNTPTDPYEWQVSGIERLQAEPVTTGSNGSINVGGAMADRAVKEAIEDLNARGLSATFYPFILMDIDSGNGLPDPYGGTEQGAFPWRGRITLANSADDGTSAATTQVNNFFGNCSVSDFGSWNGNTIPYSGPSEYSFRRMILHYAKLCSAAGGVDTFIIGSEMVELNRIRGAGGSYPSVDAFRVLAAEVKSILGATTTVVYAADWSEWNNHRPDDGSGDVIFHLDPLWADPNIDAIGIDNYMPLADWRDNPDHLDGQNYASIYDLDYLKSNIEGGEGFDWYYADATARFNQARTLIEDTTAAAEHWIFRTKDLQNWWSNTHHDRPGGIRDATPTDWIPQSKPIFFTEFGCSATDKGPNQPNVFVDPKSSESFLPYFSTGERDDFIQRQYCIAQIQYWKDGANNPASVTYGGRMVDTSHMYIWTWDARPFPEFPYRDSIWSDGENWELGHWLNGRLGLTTVQHYVDEVCSNFGVAVDSSELYGMIIGYLISNTLAPRGIIQPLMAAYFFDAFESDGKIKFKHRGAQPVMDLTTDDLVESQGSAFGGPFTATRGQLTEVPKTVRAKFILDDYDYPTTALSANRLIGTGVGASESSYNLVMHSAQGQNIVDIQLVDVHVMRERVEFTLPPNLVALDPADVVSIILNERTFNLRLEELGYEYQRPAAAVRTEASTYKSAPGPSVNKARTEGIVVGISTTVFMDLPMLTDASVPHAPWFASSATPWPGSLNMYRSQGTNSYSFDSEISVPSAIGKTSSDLFEGPANVFDKGNSVTVVLNTANVLQSRTYTEVLAGANVGAIYNEGEDEWEVFQWMTATLVAERTYILSDLLRGKLGTEHAMANAVNSGARFVVLDGTLTQSQMGINLINSELTWQYGPGSDVLGDPSYRIQTHTPKGVGLRPFSPCSPSAAKSAASNNIDITWIRRTRIGGDIWDNSDVPLSEDLERYEVDIYNAANNAVLRTIIVNDAQTFTYTEAMQIADFGSSPSSLNFEVFQISATVGRGTGRKHTQYFNF